MLKKFIIGLRKKYGVVPNPKESDVYLVSYPKSGNTWMRYLLAYSIWPEIKKIDLIEMADYVPSVGSKHDHKRMLDPKTPCNNRIRIIKTHAKPNTPQTKHIKNVIYLVRDGRDSIISYWHFCNQRDRTNIPLKDFIKKSSQMPGYYGSWSEHVTGWVNSDSYNLIVIKYEDLLEDTVQVLEKVLDFCGYNINRNDIESAVEKASFKNMKKLEKEKGLNKKKLKNIDFVREGGSGKWVNVFDEEDVALFSRHHNNCQVDIYGL